MIQDSAIRGKLDEGRSGETLFFRLALEDPAPDLFRPIWDRTDGADGWISLEVSPLLAHDTASTVAAVRELHAQAKRSNLFTMIPGSVASVFVSRRDAAVANKVPAQLRNRLGIAIAKRTYKTACELLSYNEGERPQRLLWASTGTKDPAASDVLYVKVLAAPLTVNTMPEGTVKALADHGEVGEMLAADGGDSEEVLSQFAKVSVDIEALAATLQDEGAIKSWNELMSVISAKTEVLK